MCNESFRPQRQGCFSAKKSEPHSRGFDIRECYNLGKRVLGALIRSGSLLAGRMRRSRQVCRLLWYLVKIQRAADNAGAEFRLQSDTCGDEIPHLLMYSLNDGELGSAANSRR